ncbi:TraX family protein [Alkanindiges illinoisensis]|uniref:Conjugal transfer protein TraX n=1 Tax=Alkanindiges illinoisensis TaxID=197183 RepID=A0A4Y7XDK8_9GAMM|nr:TraX family protein [Alkanindiges illinoisensis]TEU29288.1 conjugal transfer protein TraX [Alkanindiges illinoisensis]
MQQRAKAQDLVKWIAMLSMVIDHLRFIFPSMDAFIIIGRFAFPLFCLAMAANIRRLPVNTPVFYHFPYLVRLSVFAVISELPYRLLRPDADTLNILPTLLLGLLICLSLQYQSRAGVLSAISFSCIAILLNPWLMYGALGALLPAVCLAGLIYGRSFVMLAMLLSALCNMSLPTLDMLLRLSDAHFNLQDGLLLVSAAIAPALGTLLLQQKISFNIFPVTTWGYWFYPVHLLTLYFIKLIFII